MEGDYFFLPLEHVIFGAGSLERLPGELERLKVLRALIITGPSLATKTGIVRKVEETLGAARRCSLAEMDGRRISDLPTPN